MALDFQLLDQPLFARNQLARAPELRSDPDALAAGWSSSLVLLIDRHGRFPTDRGPEGLRMLLEPGVDIARTPPVRGMFLGVEHRGRHVWALPVEDLPKSMRASDLRGVGPKLSDSDAALAAEALSLFNWHRDLAPGADPAHHMRTSDAGWTGHNAVSGGVEFPRTDPAVICLVHDGGRQMLLGRNAGWPNNFYSVQAGFVEAGESLENCVQRELMEETGLNVDRIRYLGSQPWPFPRSLMLGFHALGDPSGQVRPDGQELVDAGWYDVDEVRASLTGRGSIMLPSSVSIARIMIESWVAAVDATSL